VARCGAHLPLSEFVIAMLLRLRASKVIQWSLEASSDDF
jgi:hypothetical protein